MHRLPLRGLLYLSLLLSLIVIAGSTAGPVQALDAGPAAPQAGEGPGPGPNPDLPTGSPDAAPAGITAISALGDLQVFSVFGAEIQSNNLPGKTVDTNPLPPMPDPSCCNFGGTTVTAGRRIQWDTTVLNSGPDSVENARIEVYLPFGATVIENTLTGAPSVGPKVGRCMAAPAGEQRTLVSCEYGQLTLGQSAAVRFQVLIDPALPNGTQLSFDSRAFSETPDANQSNNLTSIQFEVNNRADLNIKKFAVGSPVAGEIIHYEMSVENKGPSYAHDVTLRDFLPSKTEFVNAFVDYEDGLGSVPLACELTQGSNTVFCPLGNIPPTGKTPILVFFNVRIRPDATGSLTNSADVNLSDTIDPLVTDNSASVDVNLQTRADLAISKTSSPVKVTAGEQVKYSLTVINHGPSDAQAVEVVDSLPEAVVYEIDTLPCDAGGANLVDGGGTLTCDLGTLPAGATASFDVWGLVESDAAFQSTIVNRAEVSTTTDDNVASNNAAQAESYVLSKADLRVTKFIEPFQDIHAGDELVYTIFVDNLGPSNAWDVLVNDTLLSSGLVTIQSCAFSVTQGGGAITQLTCTTGDVVSVPFGSDIGAFGTDFLEPYRPDGRGRLRASFTLTANEAVDLTNTTTVASASSDPDTGNNLAVNLASVEASVDLALAKSAQGEIHVDGQAGGAFDLTVPGQPFPEAPAYAASADNVTAGRRIAYSLSVTNNGPSTGENVTLKDTLPAGVQLYPGSLAISQGSCNLADGALSCGLGALAPGDSVTLDYQVVVGSDRPSGLVLSNSAMAYSDNFEPDNGDNYAQALVSVLAAADLDVQQLAQNKGLWATSLVAIPGQKVDFQVTVRNTGPSDVFGARVEAQAPAGLEKVEWTCQALSGKCTPAGSGNLLDLVDLPAGGELSYKLTGVVTTFHDMTHTAQVDPPAGVTDPEPGNNSAAVSFTSYRLFHPLTFGRADPRAGGPDLVIEKIELLEDGLQVTVANQGASPVTAPFWVDVYLDPLQTDLEPNMGWQSVAASGLVWGVPSTALPLEMGEKLTLSVGDAYFWPSLSSWPATPQSGSIYAQVDSSGPHGYGAVEENHEATGGSYNNLSGPLAMVDFAMKLAQELATAPRMLLGLPVR